VSWPKHSIVPRLIEIPDNSSRALLQRFHSEIFKLETTSPATPYSKPGNNYFDADGKIQWPRVTAGLEEADSCGRKLAVAKSRVSR